MSMIPCDTAAHVSAAGKQETEMKIVVESEKLVDIFKLLADIEFMLENDEHDALHDLYDRVSVMVTNLNILLSDTWCFEHY